MLSPEEALQRILSGVTVLPTAAVPLLDARGLTLAEDAVTARAIPNFAASAMDGYAVRSEDVERASEQSPVRLRVVGVAAAGSVVTRALSPGQAVRIFTGAPVPEGTDAVVMQEHTRPEGDTVLVMACVGPGRHIRPVGNDVAAGRVVLPAGTALNPAALGMLAAMGHPTVRVNRRPRIGVLSTGDELIAPGFPLATGCIYDSNRVALHAQIEEAGATVGASLHAPDHVEKLHAALETLSECDAIVSSGGVSVGDYDFVKEILATEGHVAFWKVAIKPGKPLAFGHYRGKPFFGLPGNPVSAYVTFEVFVRPALRQMMGRSDINRPMVRATLEERVEHEPGRREFVRAHLRTVDGQYVARPIGEQDSAIMSGMARANALCVIPEETGSLEPGAMVYTLVLFEP